MWLVWHAPHVVCAWTTLHDVPPGRQPIFAPGALTVCASGETIRSIQANFYEERGLGFQFDVVDVPSIVTSTLSHIEDAIPAIRFNFSQQIAHATCDVTISVDYSLPLNVLASASPTIDTTDKLITSAQIFVSPHHCWYANSAPCVLSHGAMRLMSDTYSYAALAAAAMLPSGVWFASRIRFGRGWYRQLRPDVGAWISACSVALGIYIYLAILRPCRDCHNFELTMLHEMGHVLGLGHSDQRTNYRIAECVEGGWGMPNLTTLPAWDCAERATDDCPVMMSKPSRGRAPCLTLDDIEGLRSLYSHACAGEVSCQDAIDALSAIRLIANVAFILALVALFMCGMRVACGTRATHRREGSPVP